jgi:hypothetical protein
MMIIGEQFDPHGNEICGAVMPRRAKGDQIRLWTKTAANKEAVVEIGYAKHTLASPQLLTSTLLFVCSSVWMSVCMCMYACLRREKWQSALEACGGKKPSMEYHAHAGALKTNSYAHQALFKL